MRATGSPESFQLFTSLDEVPPDITTVLFLDSFDSKEVSALLGRYIPIQKARGYRYAVGDKVVIPTFSPLLLHGRAAYIPIAIWDFQQALKGKPVPEFPLEDLELYPTPEEFQAFCEIAKSAEFVAPDLETANTGEVDEEDKFGSVICRASLAYFKDGKVRAITFPWIEPYVTSFAELIRFDVPKVFWNGWGFDIPKLWELEAIEVKGRIYDGMWLFHFLQPTLPKALGAVTTLYVDCPEWKSKNNDEPQLYSAMDAWATAWDFVGIRNALKRRRTWELAERHVTDLLYLLSEMKDRGIRVDPEKLVEFNASLDAQMAELQTKFDSNETLRPLRNLSPKEGYKKTPKDTTGMELVIVDSPCPTCPSFEPGMCPECIGFGTLSVERWARRKPFLATSSDQVARYLELKGWKEKAGCDEKELSRLANKHKDPLLRDFIKFRKLKKLRGTYGDCPIKEDGRLHTTYTLKPTTHRLSSVDPNLQNWPPAAKGLLVASPGHKLIECDLSSVEAVLTGVFAGDPEYIRRGKIGIPKLATAQYLGLPVDFSKTDAELKAMLKTCPHHEMGDPKCEGVKCRDPRLYRVIKSVIYGGNYLAGAPTIYKNNPEDFASLAEAKKFLKFCQSLSPKIGAWQRGTIAKALKEHGLTNPWGYYCGFWDYEGDGPAACAFLPQSTCAAIIKEILLDLWQNYEAGKYLVLTIHDSIVFDVPEDRVEIVKPQIIKSFTQPWPQLNGLALGCDLKVGDYLSFSD